LRRRARVAGELVAAFTQLQSAGVQDLVLDIRYNGGGYLYIASEVAYMIAGPTPTAGQTFELTEFAADSRRGRLRAADRER
jgi:C-terminal processing protease CtpA/Prc